ncbi:hypothetical protein ES708_23037 [subsurface metagenome]
MVTNQTPSCLGSIPGYWGTCQVPLAKLAQSWYTQYTGGEPRTLIRAERSAGERAVSEIYGESGESLKTLPGISRTNSKPSVNSEGFFIGEAGKEASTRVEPSSEERLGPQQE